MTFVSKHLYEEHVFEVSRSDSGRCHVQNFRLENACLFVAGGRRKRFKKNCGIISRRRGVKRINIIYGK